MPNLWFSSVCYAWANKTWCFAMVDGSGRSTAVVKPYSRPLAHQITTLAAPLLWSSHIRNPWRIKSQAFANFWGSGPAKMMCFLRTGQQILQNYVFSDTKIHHTPLTSKSKEQRREQTNITIETCMYKIFQKVRCTLCSLSTERSQPRRSGRSPLGLAQKHRTSSTIQFLQLSRNTV